MYNLHCTLYMKCLAIPRLKNTILIVFQLKTEKSLHDKIKLIFVFVFVFDGQWIELYAHNCWNSVTKRGLYLLVSTMKLILTVCDNFIRATTTINMFLYGFWFLCTLSIPKWWYLIWFEMNRSNDFSVTLCVNFQRIELTLKYEIGYFSICRSLFK